MEANKEKKLNIEKIKQIGGTFIGKKTMLMIAGIIILVLIIMVVLFSRDSSAIKYKTEEIKKGNLTVMVTATGTLEAKKTVTVGSELSGIIKTVYVTYNDRVKAGQILAKIDTSKLEAQLAQAEASLESAKAKQLQAQATVDEALLKLKQLQKVKELSGGKMPSQTEMDSAEASYRRALAELASAKASIMEAQAKIKEYKTEISKSFIRSPIRGIVLKRNVEPGQTVAATLEAPELFTIAEDLTKMELHLNIDEADVGKIKEGQRATFKVDAYPEQTFDGKVIQVRYASKTVSNVVTYTAILEVSNPELLLRPGMTATADILVKEIKDTLLIPSSALKFTPYTENQEKSENGFISKLLPGPPRSITQKQESFSKTEKKIWILKDGKAYPVILTIGETSNGWTQVISGDIKSGMKVIVEAVTKGK